MLCNVEECRRIQEYKVRDCVNLVFVVLTTVVGQRVEERVSVLQKPVVVVGLRSLCIR